MAFINEMKNELFEKSGIAAKAMSVQFFSFVTIVSQIVVVWISAKGLFFPGGEALQNIAGTCAEIIAGLYGITLAGYTFFLSRIDALMASDMTLDYIVTSVKNRFKYLIWYITFNVLITLFISVFLMYYPAPTEDAPEFWYRLFCNEFVVFLAFSIILILYYSIRVIEPNCIEKEAAKLKKKLSRQRSKGDAIAFISMYDQIEAKCNSMIPANVLSQLHENKGKRFELTIELLYEQKPMMRPVLLEIKRIHRYYECVVNTSPMTVSEDMCAAAQRVLTYLKSV